MEVVHDREGARSPSRTEGGARHRRSGGRLCRAQAPGTPPTPTLARSTPAWVAGLLAADWEHNLRASRNNASL